MNESVGHLFIVGAPRSGSTLLQSLLATQPGVFSLPETHFFHHAFHRSPAPFFFPLARDLKKRLGRLAEDIGISPPADLIPRGIRRPAHVRAFFEILDRAARIRDKTLWVEKTPRHLYFIDRITASDPGSRFLHILREGRDVVASTYWVTRRYPEVWGRPRTLEECLRRWQRDVQISARYRECKGHFLVRYESLVDRPGRVIRRLCRLLGTDFAPALLSGYDRQSRLLRTPDEEWKADVAGPIVDRGARRFREELNPSQQDCLIRRLADFKPWKNLLSWEGWI